MNPKRPRIRVGCLGDSWVGDWVEGPSGWVIASPLSAGVRLGLEARGAEVELVAAGFPGGRAEHLLEAAQSVRVRELALLSEQGRSMWDASPGPGPPRSEDLDVLVVVLGANDLNHEASGLEVADRLLRLRKLYTDRGVKVVLVSVGGAGPGADDDWPEFEEQRNLANRELLAAGGVVDGDVSLGKLGPADWLDGWHLTPAGYLAFGGDLGEAAAACCSLGLDGGRLPPASPLPADDASDGCPQLCISGCQLPRLSNIILGAYRQVGVHCGRPMYKREGGRPASDGVLLFFCDVREVGQRWGGWWIAPESTWEHPGWAHNKDCSTKTPPRSGWQVPADGPRDETLRVTFGPASVDPSW